VGERSSSRAVAVVLLALSSGPLAAQQGAIAGRVTDASTLTPVPLARISVVGTEPAFDVVSESDGSFELRLAAGVYDLLVQASDFAPTRFDRIGVSAGLTTTMNLPLESRGFRLAGFVVTASRVTASSGTVDTEITAPSSSHAVSDRQIAERPAVSPVEHLRESPGVDIASQGLQSANLVVRGFNNIFSGALHMLTDNRLAGIPALRVNLMHFLASNDDDVERIEVVLGPGSALYGPNTANGVVHVITKSPLESQGTMVSLGGGEQSVLQGAFRSSFLASEDFGVKVSGQLLRGREWAYVDPTEAEAREEADADPEGCVTDREFRGFSPEEARLACSRVGIRDYGIQRYGLEARADWRYSNRGTLVATYGRTDASGIELTPLGAAQVDGWTYQFVQGRFTYDRWFAQAYLNTNDAGDTFLLRDGKQLVDRSTLGVVQVQNAFDVADGRLDFTYGWDFFATEPESGGTIYGDFEDDNSLREWGVYLQSKVAVSSKVDLIGVGRIDAHSILPAKVFSPRLALVFKPDEDNALRVAYNRAFSTPTAMNYFLDLGAGFASEPLGSLGYTTRAFGSGRDGFAWQNPDGSLRGMRSPFNPAGAGALLPADAASLWKVGLGAVRASLPPDVLAALGGLSPGASDLDILYLDTRHEELGLQRLAPGLFPDVPPVRESITEVLEVGWSGVLGGSVRVSADAYYMRQHDFVSPLTVENPLLFLDALELESWLADAYVPGRVADLVGNGVPVDSAAAQAAAEATAVASGISQVPLAVASSDVPQMGNGGADLIATYRNVGVLDLWGADFSLRWTVGPLWTLSATYSHVSDNWFEPEGADPVALNAPADKGTLGLAYRDEARGFDASARVRYTGPFPVLATEYVGDVEAYALLDVTLGYRLPNTAATLQVGLSNLLNTPYRAFVGVPTTGRLAMARVRYDFF